jgi:hypothetical protein
MCEEEKFPERSAYIEYLIPLNPTSFILYYKHGRLYPTEALRISVKTKQNNFVTGFRNHVYKHTDVTQGGLLLQN